MSKHGVTCYTWDAMPKEEVNSTLSRRLITGDRMMLAHVYLKKGCVVPRHQHDNEQLTYIIEGALHFWIGEDESEEIVVRAGQVLLLPSWVWHKASPSKTPSTSTSSAPARGLAGQDRRLPAPVAAWIRASVARRRCRRGQPARRPWRKPSPRRAPRSSSARVGRARRDLPRDSAAGGRVHGVQADVGVLGSPRGSCRRRPRLWPARHCRHQLGGPRPASSNCSMTPTGTRPCAPCSRAPSASRGRRCRRCARAAGAES